MRRPGHVIVVLNCLAVVEVIPRGLCLQRWVSWVLQSRKRRQLGWCCMMMELEWLERSFWVAIAPSPSQSGILSTRGADLVNCWLYFPPSTWQARGWGTDALPGPAFPLSALCKLQIWTCLPFLEQLHFYPLCCCVTWTQEQEQIFHPVGHLRERMSPFKWKGRAQHCPQSTLVHTVSVLWESLFIIVLEAASFWVLHVIPSCWAYAGLEIWDLSS